MEGELIIVTFVSSIFMLIAVERLNHNWFKKENFKLQRDFSKAKYRIDLKKMEKDLGFPSQKAGLTTQQTPMQEGSGLNIAGLLPLIKNLDPDQLQAILQGLTGEGGGGGGALENILGSLPPELIEQFIAGIGKGVKEKQGESSGSIQFED